MLCIIALTCLATGATAATALASPISITEGQPYSGQVTKFTASCSPTSATSTITWGDGAGTSAGQMSISGNQITVSGTSQYFFAEEGSYAGQVSGSYTCPTPPGVPSAGPEPFSLPFTAQVADAPLGAHAGVQLTPATTGQGSTWALGSFSDPGSSGALSDYTVTIDWGDHSQSAGTVRPCSGTFCVGTFGISGSHTYYTPGAYVVTVQVVDGGGSTATIVDRVNVLGQTVHCPSQPPSYWGKAGTANYSLDPEADVLDQNGNPTGQYTQTLNISPGYQITTNQCWIFAGTPQGSDKHALVHFATFGWVDLNGVYLDAPGDSELVVGSDGTVTAYKVVLVRLAGDRRRHRATDPASATTYQVQAPTQNPPGQGPPLVTVGQVDLGATPWTFDPASNHIGSFGPSPDGPHFGRVGITHGDIWLGFGSQPGTAGQAHVEADLPVPAFSTEPNGGPRHDAPAPTAALAYDAYNTFAPSSSSGGQGGGGGQQPPPTPCQQELVKINCGGIPFQSRDAAGVAATARHATHDGADPSSSGDWFLGAMGFGNASLSYDPSTGLWTGGGTVPMFGATLSGQFALHGDGSFAQGSASLACTSQPCTGVPLFPGVELTNLGVSIKAHPYRFGGSLGISVAQGLLTINGCALAIFASQYDPYTYNSGDWGCSAAPGSLQTNTQPPHGIKSFAAGVAADATLNVLGGIKLGGGYVFYISEGSNAYFEFAGHLGPIGLGPVSARADLAGAFDTGNGQYNASGDITGCADFPILGQGCIGLAGDVSNVGVGACAGGGGSSNGCGGPCAGFTYRWSGGFSFLASLTGSCDFGPIVVVVQRSAAGDRARPAQNGGSISFNLPKGLPAADVYLDGSGGPPQVTVTGPRGDKLTDATPGEPAKSRRLDIWPLPELNQTMVVIDHPAGGRWTITPLPGSPAVTKVAYAAGVGRPSIHTSVSDPRGVFSLRYSVRPRAGQSVEFVERGSGVFHVLGRTRRARGTLRFAPALGPGSRRQIVAFISLNGIPSQALDVGQFSAPPPPKATRPARVRIRSTPRALIISWSPSRHARSYLVTAALSDGRRLGYELPTSTQTLTIRGVERGTGARVSVLGLSPTGVAGPSATAALAPAAPPARVHGVKVLRMGKRLLISWRRLPRAVHYLVQIRISGPSPVTLYATTDRPALRPENAALMLEPGSVSRISIRGVSVQGKIGAASVLRYAPKKTRARPRGGRGRALDFLIE